jgi:hypothetical protein
MAFTPTEYNAIRRYLGYDLITPDAWRGDAAAGLARNVGRLDADGEAQVRLVLAELASVDAGIADARTRTKAEQVGDLKLNAAKELRTLRTERKDISRELAKLLGVNPPNQDLGPARVTV